MRNSGQLLIIGCGGHSKVVSDIANELGYLNIKYVDTTSRTSHFLGRRVTHVLPNNYKDFFFTAIGDNYTREAVTQQFMSRNPDACMVSLVHPSAVLSCSALIKEGVVVMPQCVINSSAIIDKGVIVNTRASVDHDCVLKSFSSLAPGATIGGNVLIGERAAISIGASVRHGVRIGSDVVVGGASMVLHDVPDRSVVYGVPASHIRTRCPSDAYL